MSLDFKGKKAQKKCKSLVNKFELVYLVKTSSDNNENEIMRMDNLKKRRKRLVIFLIIVAFCLISLLLFGTLCSDDICALSSISLNRKKLFSDHHSRHDNNNNNNNNNNLSLSIKQQHNSHLLSYDDVLNDDFQNKFDINSNDVMVRTLDTETCVMFMINFLSLSLSGFPSHTKGNNDPKLLSLNIFFFENYYLLIHSLTC
jgi:hypothetical protein